MTPFDKGFADKMSEIREMGWKAAREKFNSDVPTGIPWDGSSEGLEYAKGEFRALLDTHPHLGVC